MSEIFVRGWKSFDVKSAPELIYLGTDGAEANRRALEAQASGQFKRIGKSVNPLMVKLPVVPVVAKVAAKVETAPAAAPETKIAQHRRART